MRSALLFAAVAVSFCLAAPARAISGTVSGCSVYTDNRDEGSSSPGSLHLPTGSGVTRPLMRARMRLINGNGVEVGTGTTGLDGCYSFSWSDALAFWFPTSGFKIRVELTDPGDFYVTDPNGWSFTYSGSVTLYDSNENLGTRSIGGAEPAQVFATASEFWQRIVDKSAHLSGSMTNVHIWATEPPGAWGGGCEASCTLGSNDVSIMDGDGESRPVHMVAHELGHATSLHGLQIGIPSWDLTCIQYHEYQNPVSCDSFAFNDGIADFWAAVFSWSNNATHQAIDDTETGFVLGSIETPHQNCATDDTPWRIEACIAAALWDLYDDPSADDDVVDDSFSPGIGVATISNILKRYPDNCASPANRCSNEGGLHGLNHWDFLANLDSEIPSLLAPARSIYSAAHINEGGEGPY